MPIISHQAFSPILVRGAIFTPNSNLNGTQILRGLPDKLISLLDGQSLVIPVPDDAPKDLPVVQMSSKSNLVKFTASKERVDLVFTFPPTETENAKPSAPWFKIAEMLVEYRTSFDLRVNRIASIKHSYVKCENPSTNLAQHFCNPKALENPLKRTENFELHSHKVYKIHDKLDVNSWVRNKTAMMEPEHKQVILVEQDLNTLPAATDFNLESDDIRQFFSHSESEFQEIIAAYYPSEEISN